MFSGSSIKANRSCRAQRGKDVSCRLSLQPQNAKRKGYQATRADELNYKKHCVGPFDGNVRHEYLLNEGNMFDIGW